MVASLAASLAASWVLHLAVTMADCWAASWVVYLAGSLVGVTVVKLAHCSAGEMAVLMAVPMAEHLVDYLADSKAAYSAVP